MKLILHIGDGKTGTTTLQHTLSRNPAALRKVDCTYPQLGKVRDHREVALLAVWDQAPRIFLQEGSHSRAELKTRGEAALGEIVDLAKRERPETLIISTEAFFRPISQHVLVELRDRLCEITSDILVVCYLRDPLERFMAILGQSVRASHILPPLAAPSYERIIRGYSAVFSVALVRYDRGAFPGGDIVKDFARRFIAGLGEWKTLDDKNPSLGPEGIELMWEHRLQVHADRPNIFMSDSDKIHAALLAIGLEHGLARKLVATPQTRALIYWQFALQNRYFKEAFGIDFLDGVDVPQAPPPLFDAVRPSDVLQVDPDRKAHLKMLLLERIHLVELNNARASQS